jgi:hypothetical protein
MASLKERFDQKVTRVAGSDCWIWTAHSSRGGYGRLIVDGKVRQAHRIAWELTYGPVEYGLCVCHRCDVRLCVNPDHLFLGTFADNVHDMIAKGRRNTGTRPRGVGHLNAKLTEEKVRAIRTSDLSHGELARSLGVSRKCVENVLLGRTWRHVK